MDSYPGQETEYTKHLTHLPYVSSFSAASKSSLKTTGLCFQSLAFYWACYQKGFYGQKDQHPHSHQTPRVIFLLSLSSPQLLQHHGAGRTFSRADSPVPILQMRLPVLTLQTKQAQNVQHWHQLIFILCDGHHIIIQDEGWGRWQGSRAVDCIGTVLEKVRASLQHGSWLYQKENAPWRELSKGCVILALVTSIILACFWMYINGII